MTGLDRLEWEPAQKRFQGRVSKHPEAEYSKKTGEKHKKQAKHLSSTHWDQKRIDALLDIYCLHCLTGQEQPVAQSMTRLGYVSLVPLSNRVIVCDGKRKTQQRRLFPGYVFFQADSLSADEIRFVTNSDHVIRLLRYDTGNYALTEQDAQLIAWLWQHDGVFEVSRAYKEGNRIRIKNGPLKDLEAKIVKVNLKRSSVAIQLGESSLLGKIWCSIEMIENIHEEISLIH